MCWDASENGKQIQYLLLMRGAACWQFSNKSLATTSGKQEAATFDFLFQQCVARCEVVNERYPQ
eukprot:1938303-Amphidinium_carterae.1